MKKIDDGSDFNDHLINFIRNTCLRFLQIVYSQKESGSMKYVHGDEDKTEIKIADQEAFDLEASEVKPAIITVFGGLGFNNLGLNDSLRKEDRLTGTKAHTDLADATIGFSCLSRVGPEAERIASEVFCLFKFFTPTLRKFGFFSIKTLSIGPKQVVEAPGEPKLFLVSVLLKCQVQFSWVLEPETAASLKKMVIEGLAEIKNQEDETIVRIELPEE